MARTTSDVTDSTDLPNGSDSEAWLMAAASRKYCVKDGQVWSGVNGMLFPLPALPGFAALPTEVRGIVFHAVAQFATYRIGQTSTGNVAEQVAKAISHGDIPSPKTNDALEGHYTDEIGDRIAAKFGEVSKKAGSSAEEIKARQDAITATADSYRDRLFAEVIAAGIEAGRNKPTGDKKPRAAAKAKGEVVELL